MYFKIKLLFIAFNNNNNTNNNNNNNNNNTNIIIIILIILIILIIIYGKRPDGLTLVPWQCGKPLCWDVTVICTLAESYVNGAAREAGAAAEVAATCKEEKYADLDSRYFFEAIAVDTLGVLNSSANSLLKEIGHKISLNTGESRDCLLYTSPSPRDRTRSRMPSSA